MPQNPTPAPFFADDASGQTALLEALDAGRAVPLAAFFAAELLPAAAVDTIR